jgi:hypothetical protein
MNVTPDAPSEESRVLVQVFDVAGTRELSRLRAVPDVLQERLDDIRDGIRAGAQAVVASLDGVPESNQWRLHEVSASFGLTLTAESGVIVSKASAGATFEVVLTYQRPD